MLHCPSCSIPDMSSGGDAVGTCWWLPPPIAQPGLTAMEGGT
jgi:hypothetical protein